MPADLPVFPGVPSATGSDPVPAASSALPLPCLLVFVNILRLLPSCFSSFLSSPKFPCFAGKRPCGLPISSMYARVKENTHFVRAFFPSSLHVALDFQNFVLHDSRRHFNFHNIPCMSADQRFSYRRLIGDFAFQAVCLCGTYDF